MELKNAIEIRRSIRHFNNKELLKDKIKEVLKAGILSPSAHNRQPWTFHVINNKETKNIIGDTLINETDISTNMTGQVIKDCASLILIYGDIENDFDIESIGACIENMCLRATDLNIGSLWIGYILKIEKQVNEIVKCNKKLMAALALGYTDIIPKPRPRKALEDVTIWHE